MIKWASRINQEILQMNWFPAGDAAFPRRRIRWAFQVRPICSRRHNRRRCHRRSRGRHRSIACRHGTAPQAPSQAVKARDAATSMHALDFSWLSSKRIFKQIRPIAKFNNHSSLPPPPSAEANYINFMQLCNKSIIKKTGQPEPEHYRTYSYRPGSH